MSGDGGDVFTNSRWHTGDHHDEPGDGWIGFGCFDVKYGQETDFRFVMQRTDDDKMG